MTVIRTEDGKEVKEGDRVFNYYDHKPGTIVPGTIAHLPDPWFDVQHEDGTKALLNGARICSIAYAERRGWV